MDSLTFSVKPGQVTGFLGPNGAGKSTTMRLILGLDRAAAGVPWSAGRRTAPTGGRCTSSAQCWRLAACIRAAPDITTCPTGQEPEFRHHAAWLRAAMTQTAEPYLRQMLSDVAQRRWAAHLVPVAVIEAVIAWLDAGRPDPERAAATIGAMVAGIVAAIAEGRSWTEN